MGSLTAVVHHMGEIYILKCLIKSLCACGRTDYGFTELGGPRYSSNTYIMLTEPVLPTYNCMFNHAVLIECVLSCGHNSSIRTVVWTVRVYTRSGHQVFGIGASSSDEPSVTTRCEHR